MAEQAGGDPSGVRERAAQLTEARASHEQHADVPDELAAVVARCLAKAPDARFIDASALEDALASCAERWPWAPAKDLSVSAVRRLVDEGAPTMEMAKRG